MKHVELELKNSIIGFKIKFKPFKHIFEVYLTEIFEIFIILKKVIFDQKLRFLINSDKYISHTRPTGWLHKFPNGRF